jgi:4-amino-4-deoxy-L-arabinose transferase-like glycosyltransferase
MAGRAKIIEETGPAAKWAWAGLLLLLASVLFFFGLGRFALLGPDEPRYAEIAREMFVSGDLISPRLCGCLWFEKPALYYWMAAASYSLFGVSEFSARLPSAVMAIAAALFLFYAAARSAGPRLGFISSLLLISSAGFIGFSRAASMDMPLASSISFALLCFHIWAIASGRQRMLWWALSWAAAAISVLAKGLVGLALIWMIISVYILVRRPRQIGAREVLVGSVIFSAVVSIWYLPVTLRHGWEFIEEFFINHHFKRYLTDRYRHPQPIYFYPIVMMIGAAPWSFFLLGAGARLSAMGRRHLDDLSLLAWLWLITPLAFFSFSASKLPGYILPAFPAAAILAGKEADRFLSGANDLISKVGGILTALLMAALGIASVVYIRIWWALALAVISLVLFFLGKRGAFLAGSVLTALGVVIGIVVSLAPQLNERLSRRDLAVAASAALRPGEKIAFYRIREYAPVFYARGRVVCGIGGDVFNAQSPDQLLQALDGSSLIVIADLRWQRELESRFEIEVIGVGRDASALRLTPR